MKKKRPKSYGQFFIKHIRIAFVLWLLFYYLFLQSAYLMVYSKLSNKASVNFYEGMENIQYLIKDTALKDAEVEARLLLHSMSYAGNYGVINYYPIFGAYSGALPGIQLEDWQENMLSLSAGHSGDGQGNTNLGGFGKGLGWIIDTESGEVVYDSVMEKDITYLYLTKIYDESDVKKPDQSTITYLYASEDILFNHKKDLEPMTQELFDAKQKWRQHFEEKDPEVGKRTLTWRMNSIWRKGDLFYPAEVSLYYVDRRPYWELRGEEKLADILVEEKSFTPADPKEYTLYRIDAETEKAYAPILNSAPYEEANYSVSGSEPKYREWKPDEAFWQKALEDIRSARGRSSDLGFSRLVGNPLLYFWNGQMVFARSAYFQDGTGHVYQACAYENISELLQGNALFALWWGIYLGLIFTLASGLIAYIDYLRKRHVFMTEEYRNALMDSMAHDLKSPLMAISGYAENLVEHVNDDKREHYAEQIQKSVAYMNGIVIHNLEILKFDKDRRKPVRKDTDLRRLFEEAFDRYRGEVEEHKLELKLEGELVEKGDEELLQRAVENLVTNCIRYTPDGGSITLHFSKHRFRIANDTEIEYSGSLKKLWEPFVRGEESRTGKGTGLGLAIVANVLDRHSWKYRLHYDKVHKTFLCEIRIPMGILF